ncbi:hypothetical protein ABZ897_54195 [Nonomuraea sp. NPDC046802]
MDDHDVRDGTAGTGQPARELLLATSLVDAIGGLWLAPITRRRPSP